VTYDPAIGLVVRVTFQSTFWQTTPEKTPTLEMWELILSNSTTDYTLKTLWDWNEPETLSISWQMVQESPDHGALIHVKVLARTLQWRTCVTFFFGGRGGHKLIYTIFYGYNISNLKLYYKI
jgi:hypothetical protein